LAALEFRGRQSQGLHPQRRLAAHRRRSTSSLPYVHVAQLDTEKSIAHVDIRVYHITIVQARIAPTQGHGTRLGTLSGDLIVPTVAQRKCFASDSAGRVHLLPVGPFVIVHSHDTISKLEEQV
jgi:hypothetical protein